ncbi:MAG: hypothetical protein ACR2KH_06305, partial [Sphingomicrobium sp.]
MLGELGDGTSMSGAVGGDSFGASVGWPGGDGCPGCDGSGEFSSGNGGSCCILLLLEGRTPGA